MSAVPAAEAAAPLRPTRTAVSLVAAFGASALCVAFLEPTAVTLLQAAGVGLLVWLAAIDLEFRLLPNRIVLPATGAVLVASSLLEPSEAPERVIATVGAGALLLMFALVRPGALGMGDVKLAGLLGAILGSVVLSALTIAFTAAGLVGLALIVRSGRTALKRHLPLAPFLAGGAITALFLGS